MEHRDEIGFQVGVLSNLIHRRIDNAIHSAEGEDSCTGMQGHIIGFLYRNRSREVFQKDLQDWLSVRRSTVTGTLQLMEKRGLITREGVSRDARLKKIVLTPKGERIHEAVGEAIRQVELEISSGVTREEREMFIRLCEKLRGWVESPEFLTRKE